MRGVTQRAMTIIAAGLLLASLSPAFAQTAFEYDVQPRTFKVCRLLVPYEKPDGTWVVQAPDGRSLIFEGMRRYPDKPAGWDLQNPLAARADLLTSMNSYWETPLDPVSLASAGALPQLQDMDLIYVWAGGNDADGDPVTLNLVNPQWREALIRAVFEGAVLWIDQRRVNNGLPVTQFAPPGPVPVPLGAAPFSFVPGAQTTGAYRRSYFGVWPGDAGDITRHIADRLLQYPFRLDDWRDVQYLGMFPAARNQAIDTATHLPIPSPIPDTQAESASIDSLVLNDAGFRPVVRVRDGAAWRENIAVARYGAGAIVLTSGDVGYDVVNWWHEDPMSQPVFGHTGFRRNRPLQHEAADCKFAWNVLALAQSFSERGGSSANGAANPAAIAPPLGIQWQYPGPYDGLIAIGPIVSSPVIGRQMTYSVSMGRGTTSPLLMAFDSEPARDLDDDGRADDGIVDYSRGKSYDMVWQAQLDTDWSGVDDDWTPRWSSPTVATMYDAASGRNIEVVLVSLTRINPNNGDNGLVACFRADSGAYMWSRTIAPYRAQAAVVDVSTPTVHRDFVFVTASEYDAGADTGAGVEDTYGRAHCFQLSYPNWASDQNGPQWVFPSPVLDHNGDGDTDHATPENQRSLPPFQDPAWVAGVAPYATRPELPPFPTAKPTITEPDPPGSDSGRDTLMQCASPVSLMWAGSNVNNDANSGGSDLTLLPTPQGVVGGQVVDLLNPRAYRVWLQGASALSDGAGALVQIQGTGDVERLDDNPAAGVDGITATITGLWQDPVDGRVYAYMRSGEAREYLLPSQGAPAAPGGITQWLQLSQQGAAIRFNYQVRAAGGDPWPATWVTFTDTMPGPVYTVSVRGEEHTRRVSSATSRQGATISPADTVEDNAGVVDTTGTPGDIRSVDVASGTTRWTFRPDTMTRDAGGEQLVARGSVALERSRELAVAGVASSNGPDAANLRAVVPQIAALNAEPRLRIQLRNGGADSQIRANSVVTVETIAAMGVGTVPASAYRVDPISKTIEFAMDQAGWVNGTIGPLWGKPVWVTYIRTDPANPGNPNVDVPVADELHILPDILRFQYTPGVIKLNQSIVRWSSTDRLPEFQLPNGIELGRANESATGVAPLDEAGFTAELTGLPAGWAGFYRRPLLDVRDLRLPGGEHLRPGSEFMVSYEYLDPVTRTTQVAHERHQVPVNFGVPISSPALAGTNVHVGTEGYLPTGVRDPNTLLMNPELYDPALIPSPAQYNGTRKSLLSVALDPVTGIVRGALTQAAIPDANTYSPDAGTPVTSSSPAVDGEGITVGSRLMRRLSQVAAAPAGYQGEGFGFLSRLKPQRTLICDNTRLVEAIGQRLSWVCVGSMAAHWHEALDPAVADEDLKVTPFSRPAKATYLPDGNILVADTGNNRVIEIDRKGRQVWPLDVYGYDYYSSEPTLNPNLALDRPADCFRYYVEYGGGSARASTNGNLLPLRVGDPLDPATWTGTIMHTVIADTGNARVIDVVTVVTPLGAQMHRVDVLSPSQVRLAEGLAKLAYTRAIPIFDPGNGNVIGFLCAASNMHQLCIIEAGTKRFNPAANTQPANGSAGSTWAWLAWVYDAVDNNSDPADDVDQVWVAGQPEPFIPFANAPTNPLLFRNIRDVQLANEGGWIFLTVTCGQYGGRLSKSGVGVPHWLADQGPGIFEFAINATDPTTPASWRRSPAQDAAGGPPVTVDDPVWYFNNLDYTYSEYTWDYVNRRLDTGQPHPRRSLTNVLYHDPADAAGVNRWLEMPWNPVSCMRLPADRRTVAVGAGTGRLARHLVTNYSELVQNLSRDNVSDLSAPAMLFSSVFAVSSDDLNDPMPENDLHELDRREVIPDTHEPDWTDPINQAAYADRR